MLKKLSGTVMLGVTTVLIFANSCSIAGELFSLIPSTEKKVSQNPVVDNKTDSVQIEGITAKEIKLEKLLNAYRMQDGLTQISISPELSTVARLHVNDLQNNSPVTSSCNLHSWSSCCYTDDHAHPECMWNKPREITSYPGNGYEIAFTISGGTVTPEEALQGWMSSPGHNAVILNQGIWQDIEWKSLGVGISENYAVAWFGKE